MIVLFQFMNLVSSPTNLKTGYPAFIGGKMVTLARNHSYFLKAETFPKLGVQQQKFYRKVNMYAVINNNKYHITTSYTAHSLWVL